MTFSDSFINLYKGIHIFSNLKFKNHAQIQRGGGGGGGGGGGDRGPDPLKNHKNIGFLSNTGQDPLKITKPPFNIWAIIGTPAKCHLMAFPWRVNDGPLMFIVVFGSSLPLIN